MSEHCERFEVLISAWLDGELEHRQEGRDMLDHLVRCRACRDYYREARAFEGVLSVSGAGDATAVERAPEAIWRRIENEASAPKKSRLGSWQLKAAVLAIIAAGLAFAVVSLLGPDESRWARRDPAGEIEVEVGSRPGQMTEARFLEITTEILEADARYRRAMVEVMDVVRESAEATEGGGDFDDRAEQDERSSERRGRA